jgi:hypothetical protein
MDNNLRMPHLYLDMDGVQADLFHELARLHKVSKWEDVPNKESATDLIKIHGPEFVYDLFKNLRPLPGGLRIIKWLRDNNIPFTVLSAPFKRHTEACIDGKRAWLDMHNPGTSESCIFDREKYKYAMTDGHPNVLVDDYHVYLGPFVENGGIAVKHHDSTTDRTINILSMIYRQWI